MPHVVIIDDDEDLRRLAARRVGRAGHRSAVLSDGEAVLEGAVPEDADVVLTDVFMPRVEGMQTIAYLRRHRPDLKIIAMSGQPDWLHAAEMLGADMALSKPFSSDELTAALDQVRDARTLVGAC